MLSYVTCEAISARSAKGNRREFLPLSGELRSAGHRPGILELRRNGETGVENDVREEFHLSERKEIFGQGGYVVALKRHVVSLKDSGE